MSQKPQIAREVRHYVVRNIIAMTGTSIYVLIDTLFISMAAGALGLTALNLALPVFNLFNALGLLFGVGGATIFSLNKVMHPEKVNDLYSTLIATAITIGLVLAILITIFPVPIVNFLGANEQTRSLAVIYVRIIAWAAPLIMCNYISINFIRNDNNPTLTMLATIIETCAVVVIDWLLIFGCGLKMEGAALAVLFSPATSLVVLTFHRRFQQRQLVLHWARPSLKVAWNAAKLGTAAALNELSSGVSVYFFNHVLLMLANNYAVAAYGVISNIAIVVLAIANGVALGVQPIASREYGEHNFTNVKSAFHLGLKITLGIALGEFLILIFLKQPIISIFNTSHSVQMVAFASAGLPLYFLSVFFSATNLLVILFITAMGMARASFVFSLLRGYLILLPMIFIMSQLFGLTGVWLTIPATELIVTIAGLIFIRQKFQQFEFNNSHR